ncbi:CFI-box-CTERM domain-containing protein [Microcoleus sp. D2_18a_B4]|uniref:CFI-box-CTERM domain-containing protein n=1 Tax=Microcoleus sp. D2_18a_B4 TaxID=3055329 RepID=UPI002FD2007C
MTNFNQQDQNINHQINQVITRQIVTNNFNVNDELVENFVEIIAGILPLNADPQVKKSLILQVVIECEKSGLLPLSSAELLLIFNKLSTLSLQEFNRLLSSDNKYKKLKNRLGWFILGGTGVAGATGVGVTAVHYQKVIEDLKSNDELYKPGREPDPPSYLTEPDDPERLPINREPYLPSFDPTKSNNLGQSLRIISRLGNDFLSTPSPPPPSGGGGDSSLPSQSHDQVVDNIIEGNLEARVSDAVDLGSSFSGGIPEPQTSGSDGVADCGDIPDCGDCGDIPDCGDCGGCEPSCGCFIATAVYGSYDAPQVVSLRRFRDEKLMSYSIGRLFIAAYYQLSPPLAQWLKNSPHFAKPVRQILDRLIFILDNK